MSFCTLIIHSSVVVHSPVVLPRPTWRAVELCGVATLLPILCNVITKPLATFYIHCSCCCKGKGRICKSIYYPCTKARAYFSLSATSRSRLCLVPFATSLHNVCMPAFWSHHIGIRLRGGFPISTRETGLVLENFIHKFGMSRISLGKQTATKPETSSIYVKRQ